MGKKRTNQKGFTAVEILLTLIFLAIIAAIGVYVTHNRNTNKPAAITNTNTNNTKPSTSATTNPYAGWKTDATSLSGLSFKYPSGWTVTTPNSPSCAGAVTVAITAPNNEVSQAITASQYYVSIERYGNQSANCAPDGTNFGDLEFESVSSSDKIQNGTFSGDWLSFFSGGNNQFYPTQIDNAVLTTSSYNGTQNSINSTGYITVNGVEYQVGIVSTTANGQTETPASITPSSFKSSNLYKDSLNILNSVN